MVLAGRQGFGWAVFVLYGQKRGETFWGQQVKVFDSGPRAALQKGTAQGGAAAENSVLCGCRLSHDSCRIRGLCWAPFFFFPENNLTRVKMKGLEPLNEKGQEAGRMSEEVPSEFLIWEGNCFGYS